VVVDWEPWPDVSVSSRLWFSDGGHVREHRIVTGRTLHVAEGGFCVPVTTFAAEADCSDGSASASGGGLHSVITSDDLGRTGEIVHPMPGSHLYFPRTVLPTLRSILPPGEHVLRCHVSVSRTSTPAAAPDTAGVTTSA